MEMFLWTLGFFLLTAVMVVRHLKKTESAPPSVPAAQLAGAPCPRCSAPVPASSAFCPSCGVPQQIFEVVTAPAASGSTASAGAMRAIVRVDLCVGCGACVSACPEAGAIAMRGRLAAVDASRCVGHGECASACPVGAIAMSAGEATNRVEVPLLSPTFESTVRGLYIVGELGGRGLIKNAINEGKIAVEQIASTLRAGPPHLDTDDGTLDVVIVGSGPAGLSAGLEALRAGLRYVVLEQGSLSETVRRYPRHKVLFAEPIKIPLYGELWIADASKETLLQVWETIVANTGLEVRTGERVKNLARAGDLFEVETEAVRYRARRVVLAMGRRGTPRTLGVPGEELPKVFYDIAEMEAFAGRRVLVVGGGDSAVESALGLANQRGTTVTLGYRGDEFGRVKERNRTKLDAATRAGRLTILLRSQVKEIRPDVVVLDVAGSASILPNDNVIVRIGGEAPTAFLTRIGVRMVQKDVPLPSEKAS